MLSPPLSRTNDDLTLPAAVTAAIRLPSCCCCCSSLILTAFDEFRLSPSEEEDDLRPFGLGEDVGEEDEDGLTSVIPFVVVFMFLSLFKFVAVDVVVVVVVVDLPPC